MAISLILIIVLIIVNVCCAFQKSFWSLTMIPFKIYVFLLDERSCILLLSTPARNCDPVILIFISIIIYCIPIPRFQRGQSGCFGRFYEYVTNFFNMYRYFPTDVIIIYY